MTWRQLVLEILKDGVEDLDSEAKIRIRYRGMYESVFAVQHVKVDSFSQTQETICIEAKDIEEAPKFAPL
jgi:hypothetical protein